MLDREEQRILRNAIEFIQHDEDMCNCTCNSLSFCDKCPSHISRLQLIGELDTLLGKEER